jgi:hypothetical protein
MWLSALPLSLGFFSRAFFGLVSAFSQASTQMPPRGICHTMFSDVSLPYQCVLCSAGSHAWSRPTKTAWALLLSSLRHFSSPDIPC